MRPNSLFLAAFVLMGAAFSAQAQDVRPSPEAIYCAGVFTNQDVPHDTVVITGESSERRLTYTIGNMVYLNKGADDGAKVGDEFSLVRPVEDSLEMQWTKWQHDIIHGMGTLWADEGRVRIVEVQHKVSIAVIERMCDMVQRGDIAVPFAEQIPPVLKPVGQFDRFAPPDGKASAMIMTGKNFRNQFGNNDVVYVNLGNAQGVRAGQYFRIFRYTGTEHETAYQTPRFAFDLQYAHSPAYGFGAAPSKYDWTNTPREVLGEGIVLRTGPNSSTILVTFATRELYSGDYVELE